MSLIGPHGTPTADSAANHSSAPAVGELPAHQRRRARRGARTRGRVGGEPRVVGPLRRAEHLGAGAELPVVADGDHHRVVGRRVGLVRRDARVPVAHDVRDEPGADEPRRLVDHRRTAARTAG